jgi:hypothetical protein
LCPPRCCQATCLALPAYLLTLLVYVWPPLPVSLPITTLPLQFAARDFTTDCLFFPLSTPSLIFFCDIRPHKSTEAVATCSIRRTDGRTDGQTKGGSAAGGDDQHCAGQRTTSVLRLASVCAPVPPQFTQSSWLCQFVCRGLSCATRQEKAPSSRKQSRKRRADATQQKTALNMREASEESTRKQMHRSM